MREILSIISTYGFGIMIFVFLAVGVYILLGYMGLMYRDFFDMLKKDLQEDSEMEVKGKSKIKKDN